MTAFKSGVSGNWNTANCWGVLEQQQATGATVYILRNNAAATYLAQGFTPAVTRNLVIASLYMSKIGTPTGNVWAEVWTNNAGVPGSLIANATSTYIDVSTIATGLNDFCFPTPPSLTAATVYHIVLRGDYTISAAHYVRWYYAAAGAYAGGVASYADGTPTWTSRGGTIDMRFETYMTNGSYPFQLSAADTAINLFGISRTISADNVLAGTGAVTNNLGGTITNNFNQTQNFCGAIAQNGKMIFATGSKMQVSGSVTGNSLSEFDHRANSILQFNVVAGVNSYVVASSKVTMVGTSSVSKDCIIQGTAGGEVGVVMSNAGGKYQQIQMNNVTFQYCKPITGQIGAVYWNNFSAYRNGCEVIGNIDFKNNVGAYDLYAIACNFNTDTGTLTFLSNVTTSHVLSYGNILRGTWTNSGIVGTPPGTGFTTSSISNTVDGAVMDFVGTGNGIYLGVTTMFSGDLTGRDSGAAYGIQLNYGGNYIGGTIRSIVTTATSTGIYIQGCNIESGMVINTDGGSVGIIVAQNTKFAATANISNADIGMCFAANAMAGLLSPGANIIIDDTVVTGFNCVTSALNTIQHTSGVTIVNEATNAYTKPLTQQIEPFVYVRSRASKYFDIAWNCFPCDWATNWATTGLVSFNTTAGYLVMTNASTIRTSTFIPWQVIAWGTFTSAFTTTRANPTYQYEVSYDGGVTWGSLTTIASGAAPAETPKGNGLDAIRFTVTCAAGSTVTMDTLILTSNVYDDIAYVRLQNYLVNTGRKIKQVGLASTPPNPYRWMEY
jgi:hypothetical protein